MDNYIYGKNSVEFVTVALEFCSFIERANEVEQSEFLAKINKLLPLLYLKVSLIEYQPDYVDVPEQFVTEEDYNMVRTSLEGIIADKDTFLEVFVEDMKYSDTPISASISEELADIYQPLKDFLSVYSIGNEDTSRAALTICIEEFRQYWGQKVVNVMRPLHAICYAESDEFNENEFEDNNSYTEDSIF